MLKKVEWLNDFYISILEDLQRKGIARVQTAGKKEFLLKMDDIMLLLRTQEELEILFSIYLLQEYNLQTDNQFTLIDVGMNVGITALYFASKANVNKVIGFEPVREIFECLRTNLALNEKLAKKIIANNFGLGGTSRMEKVEYSFEFKGGTGILGLPEDIKKATDYHSAEIALRDAGEVLAEIVGADKEELYVLKMDCEGAEYEIFDNNKFIDALEFIQVVMLEYHRFGYEIIVKKLQDKNFQVHVVPNSSGINGMIYASKAAGP